LNQEVTRFLISDEEEPFYVHDTLLSTHRFS
jgi:hypothetical protein